jgi:uncharacterized protein (TIGR02594 family)
MPDDPPADLADVWGQAMAADPATRRRGMPPTAAPTAQPQASPPTSDGPPQQPPVGQAIADTAAKLAGKSAADVRPFLQQTGQALDPTRMAWCAAFVNGVLAANGVQGTTGEGKNIATGFLNWGVPVQGEPQPGDVLVLPKGHPAGGLGGHVGIATGQVADGPGGTFYLMQSGNESDRVAYTWEPAKGVVARRAPPTPQGQGR